jgi:succinylglutamate desuccinylase
VVLEAKRREDVILTNSPDDALRVYISRTNQEGIRKELTKAIALKSAWTETLRAIEQEREALASLDKNQARLRENLKILEKTSDLYRSSMKRFEAQEAEFDQRQAKIAELQKSANKQRRDYETFVRDLKVE